MKRVDVSYAPLWQYVASATLRHHRALQTDVEQSTKVLVAWMTDADRQEHLASVTVAALSDCYDRHRRPVVTL